MLIPYQQLDEITLNNIIEQYILREGTDYGEIELSLQEKTLQLLAQIKRGDIYIIYSELEESVTLISQHSSGLNQIAVVLWICQDPELKQADFDQIVPSILGLFQINRRHRDFNFVRAKRANHDLFST